MRSFSLEITAALVAAVFISSCSAEAKKERLKDQADRDFTAGEYDKAKIQYMNLLRLDPQNAHSYERLGLIWFAEGAPLRAAPFLLKARELAPGNVDARVKLATIFMSVGEIAEARKEALAILQQAPGSSDAIKILVDLARTPQEVEQAQEQLQKLPEHDNAAFILATAALALRKGDTSSAETALQRALVLEPNSPSPHMAMASYQLFRKNTTQAEQELKAAADLAPLRSTERLKYAEYKARAGAFTEAVAMLRSITKQAPDYLPAWCLLAQIAATNKNYDESLSLLENVFSRDAENLDGRILQAQTFMAKNEAGKALETLERLDKKYPNLPPVRYQLARAYLQNNNPAQARSILTQTVAANPNHLEAVLLLGELDLHAGNADAVVTSMEGLLKKQPELFSAQVLLADAYRALGRLDEAAAIFRERAKGHPQESQSYLLEGVILRQQKRNEEARKAFEQAQLLAPENPMITEQLVELDIQAKDFAAATRRVEQQLSKNPQSAHAHFMEAKIQVAQKKLDSAETALQKTLELDPSFGRAYDLLISTYLASNKLPQALTQLQGLLAKKPENAPALMLSALIYDKLGDYAKARDGYEKLLSFKPDFTPALNNLAYVYAERLNQYDKAYEIAKKARSIQPSDPSIADTLGWILYRQGNYQQAVTLLQESASKLADNAEIQFHLGMASYMMGQTDVARAAFEKAAAAPGEFPGKDQIHSRLELLKSGSGPELPVSQLEALSKQQPADPVAQMRLGEAYEKQKSLSDAAKAYEEALKLNPRLVTAATKLAELYSGPLHDNEKSLEFAKRARELSPNDPKMAGILGRIAYRIGNFPWAYSLLQESSRQLADDAVVVHDLAWAAYSLGKVDEAERAMQRVVKLAPSSADANDAKSFLAMIALGRNEKDPASALVEVESMLRANTGYVPALMVQASINVQQGRAKPAARIYEGILRRFPDFAPAQKNLAALYAGDSENLGKAYDLATKARKTLTDDPELEQTLATISYQKKDYGRAIQLFQASSRQKPLDANALFYLGMSQARANQKSQATEILNRAMTAGLQEPRAAEARQTLADLQRK